jgi:hypothetical protein
MSEYLESVIKEYDSLKKIVEQLEFCNYKDEFGHALVNNVAFIALKGMADSENKT